MALTNEQVILDDAERLYLHDAMFHADVYQAVQLVEWGLRARTGRRLSNEDRSLATHAAAVALVAARRPALPADA